MANNWYDSALTLTDKETIQRNKQKMKKDKERPPTKRTMYENLRSSKSRRLTARHNVTRQSLVNTEVDDQGYDEDVEDNDDGYDEDNLSGYAYAAPVISNAKTPRVQTSDGPEGCSCFPKRSNKRIPSMLYEGLQCRHTGLKGETHAGVSKFDHNWREEYEEPDPSGVMTQKTNYYLGYPRPVNLDPDLQYYDEQYEGPEAEQQNKRITQTQQSGRKTSKSKQNNRTSTSKQSKKEKQKKPSFPYGLLDFMIEEGQTPPTSKPQNEGMPITLPRIGYSPPPPSRERLSARSVARSLPPLPESPFLSSRQNKIRTSRSEKRAMSEINGNDVDEEDEGDEEEDRLSTRYSKRSTNVNEHGQRRFKGHYYDPATKRTRTYEIKPNFRKGLGQWNAYIGDKSRQASMVSALQGRRTTNGNFYTRDNLSVMEDDEYDDDEDDYNEEEEDENDDENIESRTGRRLK